MSSKLSSGYGFVIDRNGHKRVKSNFSIPTKVKNFILNAWMNDKYVFVFRNNRCQASPLFNRYNRKRYESAALKIGGSKYINNFYSGWDADYGVVGFSATDWYRNRKYVSRSLVEADNCAAISSIGVHYYPYDDVPWSQNVEPFLPDSSYAMFLMTNIDVPGTEIGPTYKHEIGSVLLFDDVGDTPSSQGDIVFSGVFDPPEGLEGSRIIQVYFATSGGTGTSAGKSGSNGVVTTGDPDRFTDSTAAAFVVGDEGKYIKINSGPNRGIYKIPTNGYIDANNVDTDAFDINSGFTNENNIDWELVTGPIGEYFFRTRPYTHGTAWSNGFVGSNSSYMPLNYLGHELGNRTLVGLQQVRRYIYDRGGSWWWIVKHPTADGLYGLMRWCHMSPSGMDPVYRNVDIGGSMPTDLFNWSDIGIDDADKIWVGVEDATSSTDRLFRIDPYPGTPPDASSPTKLAAYGKQSNIYTADGLTADTVLGICCDDSQAIAAGTRIWIFGGDDGSTEGEGGITYTDDYGTTLKRIHILHTIVGETLTVTNGSPNVTGGTSLNTKIAVGDWIRFGADTRSYEVSARAATTMTLTENYQGANGSYSVQKGALTVNEAVLLNLGVYTSQGSANADFTHQPPCDYDSEGRVYWLPSGRDRVCKWDESTGQVTTATMTDLGQTITAANPGSLKISRVPNIAGSGNSIWHDNIWIGLFDITNGGWVRIQKKNFEYVNDTAAITVFADAGSGQVTVTSNGHGLQNGCEIQISGTTSYNGFFVISNVTTNTFEITTTWVANDATGTWLVVVTRYHWSTITSFPKSVDLTNTADSSKAGWNTIIEPKTGQIYLSHDYNGDTAAAIRLVTINMDDGDSITESTHTVRMAGSNSGDNYWNTSRALGIIGFDDVGIGSIIAFPFGVMHNYNQSGAAVLSPVWICQRWDGDEWLMGPLNQINADIDFNGTPKVEILPTVGGGLRRVHDWNEELWAGVNVKFEQNGGATPQNQEYIEDESATSTCYIGTGKDNLAKATWGVDVYATPTVYRLDEPVKDLLNQWTSNGGIDGGYKSGGIASDVLTFSRGPAENTYSKGLGYSPYWNTSGWDYSNPDPLQLMAALRIDDEFEFNNDGIIAPGGNLDRFQSTGYSFTANDVGKSIITEGYTGANNGQFIITDSVPSSTWPASTVTVTPNFNANEVAAVGKRWKLRDIPAVGYVALQIARVGYVSRASTLINFKLYSSGTYGATWSLQKEIEEIYNKAANDNLGQDNGFFNFQEFGQFEASQLTNSNAHGAFTVFFRLTDIAVNSRRRQYWKIFKDLIGVAGDEFDVASIILFDDSFNILGRASGHKIEDANDSLFSACLVGRPMLVPYESTTTGQPSGSGTFTDLISAASESFYEHNGTNTGQVTLGTNFTSTDYYFSYKDIGKYIRINESGYADNGFHVITSLVSSTQVVLGSTGLLNQANLDWQLLTFGPGDFVRFTSDTLFSHREGVELEDIYYKILDVPSNITIQLVNTELPVQIAGSSWSSNFDINRDPDKIGEHTQYSDFKTGGYMAYDPKFGTLFYSDNTEFVEIENGVTATSTKEWGGGAIDNDGDGRVDAVNIGTVLAGKDGSWTSVADNGSGKARFTTGGVHNMSVGDFVTLYNGPDYDGQYKIITVSDATHFDIDVTYAASADTGSFSSIIGPGDYILLTGSSNYGRRVLEIRDITRGGAATDVRFTYDELYPSDTFTNWYIYTRREWLRTAQRRAITVLNETP